MAARVHPAMATRSPISTRAGLSKTRRSNRVGPVLVNDPVLPSAADSRERPDRSNGSRSNSRIVRPWYGSAEILGREFNANEFMHWTNVDYVLGGTGTLINPTRLSKLRTRARLLKEVRRVLKSNFRPDGFTKLRIHIQDQEDVPDHMRREYHYVDMLPGMTGSEWAKLLKDMHSTIRVPVNLKIEIIC